MFMVSYTLKPKKARTEHSEGTLDIIVEGKTILEILTEEFRFPETKRSIKEYVISVKNNQINFELEKKLGEGIYRILSNYWDIEEK